MIATALGHQLETLQDGATCFAGLESRPIPLKETRIDVKVAAGLASVTTTRVFRNDENVPIEAVLTMPVGFDAVVTGLSAKINGKRFIATAKSKTKARDEYEVAIDRGQIAVLHEEVLRGVHVLSVGSLPPGAEVSVVLETMAPMSNLDGEPFLRIPTTVGQIYGASPLMPADDLVSSSLVRYEAELSITTDEGTVHLLSEAEPDFRNRRITLDHAIEFNIREGGFGKHWGTAADGRSVELSLSPLARAAAPLDLAILVDRSGSTCASIGAGETTVWEAMRRGLERSLAGISPTDSIVLWQFDTSCVRIGATSAVDVPDLLKRLEGPRGGTELGQAIWEVLTSGARKILVLTDGLTHAHEVEQLKSSEATISSVLVGDDSLDANIGHLCAMTGGQVFYAKGSEVASAIEAALSGMRFPARHATGRVEGEKLSEVSVVRGGIAIKAKWLDEKRGHASDAIGRFAASLALPLLSEEASIKLAVEHGLCTHLTSLVLVDESNASVGAVPEMRKFPLMRRASVPSHAQRRLDYAVSYSLEFDFDMSDMTRQQEKINARLWEEELRVARHEEMAKRRAEEEMRANLKPVVRNRIRTAKKRGSQTNVPPMAKIERLAATIDWAQFGGRLARGDISPLDRYARNLIQALANHPEVSEIAWRMGNDAICIAVALVAVFAPDNRYACRIVRSLNLGDAVLELKEALWG